MCCCEDPDIDGTPAGRGVVPARRLRRRLRQSRAVAGKVAEVAEAEGESQQGPAYDEREEFGDEGYLLYRRRTWIYVLQAVSASLATASIVWAASIALDRFVVYTLLDARQRRSNVLLAKVAFIGSQSCAWIVHFFGTVQERDELWAVHRRIFFLVACWVVDAVKAIGALAEWSIDRVNQARGRDRRSERSHEYDGFVHEQQHRQLDDEDRGAQPLLHEDVPATPMSNASDREMDKIEMRDVDGGSAI